MVAYPLVHAQKEDKPSQSAIETPASCLPIPRDSDLLYVVIVLFALLLRYTVSLWPYSGTARPCPFHVALAGCHCACAVVVCVAGAGAYPMYGDFEAQRHWMEVTVNLPIGTW